jgi:mannose-6-phosphate isomerase-like protein (cupin superfamily)
MLDREKRTMTLSAATAAAPLLALALLAASSAPGLTGDKIEVTHIDAMIRSKPLPPGVAAAEMVGYVRAGDAEISVLVLSRNRLHHHAAQDHVLYVVRGRGIARLESASGQIEKRPIQPGDFLALPRGRKHGFEKSGEENLVFLVVATPLPPGAEETTYHE